MSKKYLIIIASILFSLQHLTAQEKLSSDSLFQLAREAAFDKKDYSTAIELSKRALKQSPDYTDIQVFLGRVYTWNDKPDSARAVFEQVLQRKPGNEDASFAYASLEFWNNNSNKALSIAENGLSTSPDSKDLLLIKSKILNDLGKPTEASNTIAYLLKKDPKNTEARALAERLKENSSKNKIGVGYDFVYFDEQFSDPWHLASIDYGRQTPIGSVTARLNYANRFSDNGTQVELEAYPSISKTFYAYVGAGYSGDVGIFPKYRAGFSLYANLPSSFEAEAGIRFLHFTDNTTVYTLSAGKYVKNYWFNFRTYLTPSGNDISQSYALTFRYYYGGSDDYFSVGAGTGISPDETSNNILLNTGYKLRSNNITGSFRHLFNRTNVLALNASWQNQEYRRDTRGNQFTVGLGYQKRF
ncbi:YaiO family outer membrane beta-barrel protein [Desertivirga arenae]|uniref:YaiO family outer membrane beta-barrel protein n=1 Tax=Desertivirga arenae TaxID=2810309 RepID=UPI001A9789BB|nr:YaiO family outer membrane beta-barrel protein [Pedobacter sp. SYSU D00823]